MQETNYGKKTIGTSPFVIIAPHAAGDDLKTGYIAKKLATELNAFAVINTTYKKPTNSTLQPHTFMAEDFNKLMWWYAGKKYLWSKRHPDMKLFFRDIREYTKAARELSTDKKAICIHIHGMKSVEYAIDLGAGIPDEEQKFKKNTGTKTLDEKLIDNLKQQLEKYSFENHPLKISIGKYSGISRQSAIQFHVHQGYNDHALQIEISSIFRIKKQNRDFMIHILSKTLTNIFLN